METEDVVVDDPIGGIEHAHSDQYRTEDRERRQAGTAVVGGPPDDAGSEAHHPEHRQREQPVVVDVLLEAIERPRIVAVREQMVALEDLMEDDHVEDGGQADAEHPTPDERESTPGCGCNHRFRVGWLAANSHWRICAPVVAEYTLREQPL